ncbi:Alpha-2-macroglobulin-like protein 1, partial [Ophiophagus hannah]
MYHKHALEIFSFVQSLICLCLMDHYLVVFPAIIGHPNVEKFCILLRSLQETNYLLVTLELKNQNHTLAEKDVEAPGTFEFILLRKPALLFLMKEEAIAKVHILIQKGSTVTFEAQKKVLLKKASPRSLIQPSKALYKPREIVKWRIVRLDDEFKAIDKIIPLIQLKDPDENRIAQWVDVKPLHGIVDLSFPLASEAALGTYTIEMEDKELSSKADGEFIVEEYGDISKRERTHMENLFKVRTTLLDSEEVEVKPCLDCLFTTCLCAEEAKVFSWNVTATQLGKTEVKIRSTQQKLQWKFGGTGHVNISVRSEAEETKALCGNKISVTPTHGQSDTVIKSLLVKPEGVLEEKAQNTFLCSSGDITGAALENIDQLLQMPFGCGEQNMIKFVPNIVVLQYLEETNQVTRELRNPAIEHMKSGYQRQLLYKHDDGSYSAFGKRDEEGNTW